jgi:2-amino-4-hydroxy-6-hydroxymethyldihydropteridine diphosphokinase
MSIPPGSAADLPWEQAAIALGSNQGDSHQILTSALKAIASIPEIRLQAHSHYYQTVAIGPPQPDYLNACALITTCLTPQRLLHMLLKIEQQFGRVRRERWGPRLLDLDLLLFDHLVLNLPDLQIPHPRMTERAFVLVPLAEIAADWVEPVSGRAIAELTQTIDQSGIKKCYPRSPTL